MKAFYIWTKPLPAYTSVPYQDTYVAMREDDISYAAIAIAESRGKAKSVFFNYVHGLNDCMEWTDIESVRLLTNDADDYESGIIDDAPEPPHIHPLWYMVADRFWEGYWDHLDEFDQH